MSKFLKYPKFILSFFKKIRTIKVKLYKSKKIKESKTDFHRNYHITFSVNIEDEFNPQKLKQKFHMIVPGKAAYFAKRNLKKAMLEKIDFNFIRVEEINDEDYKDYLESMEDDLNRRVEN